jgi:hypothetical protein
MPSEKAQGNKTLVAPCEGCGKTFSTELLTGLVTGSGRDRRIVPLCQACLEKGSSAAEAT